MSESQITKRALANSIKQLMEKKPLKKISIQNIVDNCGLNRQTFYYHFRDKYDLVNWIYSNEVIANMLSYSDLEHWNEVFCSILIHMSDNKAFYTNALNTTGQNSFNDYFFEVTEELILNVLEDLTEGMNISKEDKKFIADFYSFAFIGLAIQWARNDMKEDPKVITAKLKEIVDGTMLRIVSKYSKEK